MYLKTASDANQTSARYKTHTQKKKDRKKERKKDRKKERKKVREKEKTKKVSKFPRFLRRNGSKNGTRTWWRQIEQKHLGAQGSLFASDIKMYIGICLGDVSSTRKQYITNASLVMNNTDLNHKHVVQLAKALTYLSHLHTLDIPTNLRSSVQTYLIYHPNTPAGK